MNNKVWAILGGSGSLGNELTKRIIQTMTPSKVIIFSRDELKQKQMAERIKSDKLRFIIGDVSNYDRLRFVLRGVDYVVLAAAMKHVDTCEYNTDECIKTNVVGAQATVDAAIDCRVSRVIFTSTDKSCQALNTYGSSKFLAERVIINGNQKSGRTVKFACTRYGNVSGSRGSVIPIWRDALTRGETIKVTDGDMTRYWMTLEESVDLVIYAMQNMRGGEVFIPDLPAYDIQSLADAFVGRERQVKIDVRPGEKQHESMLSEDEAGVSVIDLEGIYRILPNWYERDRTLRTLQPGFRLSSNTATMLQKNELKRLLKELFESEEV